MSKLLVSLVLVQFFSITSWADYHFNPELGAVEFKTQGWPSLVTIKGQSKGVTGVLEDNEGQLSGELTFDLSQLKTGIDLRDTHMKDNYLEVKKFPTAKLIVKELKIPADKKGEVKIKAQMELHGVTKDVEGTAQLNPEGQLVNVEAQLPIKLSDFNIAIPNYKGITVAEKVEITFKSAVKVL